MNVAEAARHLGVSRSTIYRGIRSGKVDAVYENGRWDVRIGRDPDKAPTRSTREQEIDLIERYNAARSIDVVHAVGQDIREWTHMQYPIERCSLYGWFSQLHLRTHMPSAPKPAHLAPPNTLSMNSVEMELQAKGSDVTQDFNAFGEPPYIVNVISRHLDSPVLAGIQNDTGSMDGHLRLRARLTIRAVFADGSGSGTTQSCPWSDWSDWHRVYTDDRRWRVFLPDGTPNWEVTEEEQAIGPEWKDRKFWDVIRELREVRSLSVAVVASSAGIAEGALQEMEGGWRAPTDDQTRRLADVLKVPTRAEQLVALRQRDIS